MSTYVKKEDGTLIESDTEVVKVESNSLKKLLDNTKSCYYLFSKYKVRNNAPITDLIQFNDTEKVTNFSAMFFRANLNNTEIPSFNISNATNTLGLFSGAVSVKKYPYLDTKNLTSMQDWFSGSDLNDDLSIFPTPFYDTSNVTNMENMFGKYDISGSQKFFFTLTELPLFNTSNVTIIYNMFSGCKTLKTIPSYDFSNVTGVNNAFYECEKLEQFLPTGLKVSFNLSSSTKFTREALVVVLNNLGTPTSTQTLTLGSTNLAKLTEEDIAIATEKNWTLQ